MRHPRQDTTSPYGFSTIEMLTVVAIIGILASVVMVSLSGVRTRSRTTLAQSTLEATRTAAQACLARGAALATNALAQTPVCAGAQSNWPELPAGWSYSNPTQADVNLQTYQYGAQGDGTTYTCTQTGCS